LQEQKKLIKIHFPFWFVRLFMLARVRPIVFAGPSGAGKSTLIKKLMTEFPSAFGTPPNPLA
jgi:guanylate kinase